MGDERSKSPEHAEPTPWPFATRSSIRLFLLGRLTLWLLPIVALSMFLHWRIERTLLIEMFDEGLIDRAQALATVAIVEEGEVVLEFDDQYMPGFAADNPQYFFQVWLPSGATLGRSESLNNASLPRRLGDMDDPISFDTVSAGGERRHCVGVRFPSRSRNHDGVAPEWLDVVVGARGELLSSTLDVGLFEVIRGGLLTAAAIAFAVFLTLRQGSLLISGIAQAVRFGGAAHLNQSSSVHEVPHELESIVTALHHSRAETAEILDQERSFNANVAHELRTPISELRTTTEVALRFRDEVDPYEALADANSVSLKMGRTVNALLQLARLQSPAAVEDEVRFDLVATIRRSFSDIDDPDLGRVTFDLPESCFRPAGSVPWAIVADNLADNALTHSPPGSAVCVTLIVDEQDLRLVVSNLAPDLLPDDLRHLTERLWRRGSGVARGSHSGLGLSITAATCRRLGAELLFELSDGHLTATVMCAT